MAGTARKLVILVMLGLLASGCAGQKKETLADFPTLASLRSRVPPHYKIPDDAVLPQPEGVIVMQAVDVPLTADLSPVWQLINEHFFDKRMREAWHANGLRIGVVSVNKLKQISKALPRLLRNNRVRLTGSAHPMELYKGAMIDRPLNVYTPKGPGHSLQRQTVDRGRAQLLETVAQEAGGSLYLELTPHIYWPALTIKPQSQMQRQLDGTIYRSLAMGVDMSPNEVLVIGLYLPPTESFEDWKKAFDKRQERLNNLHVKPIKPTPPKKSTKKTDTAKTQSTHSQDRKPLPIVPRSFGRLIMIDPTFGGNRQTLLFIGVHHLSTPRAGQAANRNPASSMGGD